MSILADAALLVVALLHMAFLVLEMFLWTRPIGRRVFGLPPNVMAASRPSRRQPGPIQRIPGRWIAVGTPSGGSWLWRQGLLPILRDSRWSLWSRHGQAVDPWLQGLPGAVALALVLLART